jgi:hypothetical protein
MDGADIPVTEVKSTKSTSSARISASSSAVLTACSARSVAASMNRPFDSVKLCGSR